MDLGAHRRGLVVAPLARGALTTDAPAVERSLRAAIAVTLAAGVVRLVLGAVTPLFPDETYYWDWSRRLATGYFDHPPMIAWLIRMGTTVAGDTPLGVRLMPVVAGVVAGLFVVLAARRLAGLQAAWWSALIFALMPLSAAGLILATPDAPLFAAAAAAVYAVVRALEHPAAGRASLGWWIAAGVALGAGFTSKYTAALLPIGVLIALLTVRDLRARLREPGPYVAVLVALILFAPVVWWNATHSWASFAFQLRHGFGGTGGSAVNRVLEMLGGQLGLVTPVVFVMMTIAAVRARSELSRLLAVAAAVIFVFFMYSATKRRVEANWPALAYVPGILLLATHVGGARWTRWMRGGLALAALVTALTYVNTLTPILPVPARRDPVARAAGWNELAGAVNRTYAARRSLSSYRTWVAADRYQEASALAFHLPDHPFTFSLNLTTRRNHYDYWPGFPDRAQPRDAMILVVDEVAGPHPTVALLTPHFSSLRADSMVTLARNGDPVKYLRIWHLEGWRGTWPGGALRSRP